MSLSDKVFFTRMHIRYNRSSFPQELMFQTTPADDNFQARHIITHPATGYLSCAGGKKYLTNLRQRRLKELKTLVQLTGKDLSEWKEEAVNNENLNKGYATYSTLIPAIHKEVPSGLSKKNPSGLLLISAFLLAGAGLLRWKGMV